MQFLDFIFWMKNGIRKLNVKCIENFFFQIKKLLKILCWFKVLLNKISFWKFFCGCLLGLLKSQMLFFEFFRVLVLLFIFLAYKDLKTLIWVDHFIKRFLYEY